MAAVRILRAHGMLRPAYGIAERRRPLAPRIAAQRFRHPQKSFSGTPQACSTISGVYREKWRFKIWKTHCGFWSVGSAAAFRSLFAARARASAQTWPNLPAHADRAWRSARARASGGCRNPLGSQIHSICECTRAESVFTNVCLHFSVFVRIGTSTADPRKSPESAVLTSVIYPPYVRTLRHNPVALLPVAV
jgi:hypothetical protein